MKRDRRNQKSETAITKSIALVEKWRQAYERVIEGYEKDHPHWRIEVLVSLIKWSLRSLKHYIEHPRESKMSWADPFVELHFPVGWNWSPRRGEIVPCGHLFGQITSKNVATKAKAHKTLARIMVEQLNAMTLADATNWACYEKRNNYYTPVFPIETTAYLISIKGKRARQAAFEELVRPFAIGATRIDASVFKLKSGKRVPKKLLESVQQMDIPGVRFSGDVNGRKFDMGLVFEIHPLIADYDRKIAYHPVVVGLAVLNACVAGGEVVQETPANWPESDQEEFWEGLLREMEKLVALLIPKVQAEDSIILSVNSQIKVPASCWYPEHRSSTIKQIADLQSAAGELQGLSVQAAGNERAQIVQPACPVCGWMHDANFTQIRLPEGNAVSLSGVLPDIVRLVHQAHEKGFAKLSTKDDELINTCGGYRHPCKAFDDLNHQAEYKLLFDTRRRGFIALRGVAGTNRNKSETSSE